MGYKKYARKPMTRRKAPLKFTPLGFQVRQKQTKLPAVYPTVKEVRLRRAEGPNSDPNMNKWLIFPSIIKANRQLSLNSDTVHPGASGTNADKHDFIIVWDDGNGGGDMYKGTYELKHGEIGDIHQHIINFANGMPKLKQLMPEQISEEDLKRAEWIKKLIERDLKTTFIQ